MRRATLILSLAALMAGVGGCNSKNSSSGGEGGAPIATRDMELSALVEAEDETTARVSASLHDGKLVFKTEYNLTGGDALRACIGLQCRQLERDFFIGSVLSERYGANFAYVAETPYTIELSRRVDASAPQSVVTLPVPFAILSPAAGTRVTDGDMITVQWSPEGVGDTVMIDADVLCRHEDGTSTDRLGGRLALRDNTDGSAVLPVDPMVEILPTEDEPGSPVRYCNIELEVAHERRGTIDPLFAGGYILGRVVRKVTLEYRPSQP